MSMAIEFVKMKTSDAAAVASMLAGARAEYVQHFHPFPFTNEAIQERLNAVKKDQWWMIQSEGQIAGVFFLRGFDEGYERPAFGIFVDERFARRGLAKNALDFALDWCRRNAVETVMLKVHGENTRARRIYEDAGFMPAGICPRTEQQVMERRLSVKDSQVTKVA